jgi:hypothetical protein
MSNEQQIWAKLLAAGLTAAGAAGLMGNFQAESNLEPTNLQNTYERKLGYTDATYTAAVDAGTYADFATDAAGYGLAQWTYGPRKKALLAFAKAQNKSIGDLEMQVEFAIKELRESYPAVWNVLTTTDSVQAASDVVLLQFERPADTSASVRTLRRTFGERIYARNIAAPAPAEETLPNPPMPEQTESRAGTLELNGKLYAVTEI